MRVTIRAKGDLGLTLLLLKKYLKFEYAFQQQGCILITYIFFNLNDNN